MKYRPDPTRMKELMDARNWGSDVEKAKHLVASVVSLKTGVCSSLSETHGVTADAAECERLFAQLCRETENLITENWPAIERVAKSLQYHRVLTQDEIDRLMATKA
jgi:hypothetical protein